MKFPETDPILDAIDAHLEAQQRKERPRRYLGGSAIGDECRRKVFYGFRWSSPVRIGAMGLKAIADGHATEALMIQRIRSVEGVELWVEEDGSQIGFSDMGGHFQGNVDGIIQHDSIGTAVWECKAVNVKKFDKFKKLKDADPDTALQKWDTTYYGQAQVYMHYLGIERHYLTVSSPGGRDASSVVTHYNAPYAEQLVEAARGIIFGNQPAPRLSGDPSWYQCKFCPHHAICHGTDLPQVNCRTCAFSTPLPEGGWRCEKHDTKLDDDTQHTGCQKHRYHPKLLSGIPEDQDADGNIRYTMNSGETYLDGDKA